MGNKIKLVDNRNSNETIKRYTNLNFTMNDNIKISKSFTVGDWKELRPDLIYSDRRWMEAFDIFEDRLKSRFFNPIDLIKAHGKNEGEGFSITLVSVVMLESLAAFELGKIYKSNKDRLSPCEYNSGIKLFRLFFNKSKVFSPHFSSKTAIENFYENIRCGLVHEGRTLKNDVIISENSIKNTQNGKIYFKVEGESRLNRDLLLLKTVEYIEALKNRIIQNDISTRNNFILKMDEISGLKHVWYFIYGSNLKQSRLNERLGELKDNYLMKVNGLLHDYEFTYNKKSDDGTSKGNLYINKDSHVHGVAILLLKDTLDLFVNKYEKGYKLVEIEIESLHEDISYKYKAYTCISDLITDVEPSKEYVELVVSGAIENNLPEDYIENKLKRY